MNDSNDNETESSPMSSHGTEWCAGPWDTDLRTYDDEN